MMKETPMYQSYAAVAPKPEDFPRLPDAEALVSCHQGVRYTYAELDRAADRAAGAFAARGVGPGDRVAASLPNGTEIVIAFLGAARLGAIWVGINRALAGPEKAYMLRDCGARLLLADELGDAQRRRGLTGQVLQQFAVLRGVLLLGQPRTQIDQADQLALRDERDHQLDASGAQVADRGRVERHRVEVNRPARVLEVHQGRIVR